MTGKNKVQMEPLGKVAAFGGVDSSLPATVSTRSKCDGCMESSARVDTVELPSNFIDVEMDHLVILIGISIRLFECMC